MESVYPFNAHPPAQVIGTYSTEAGTRWAMVESYHVDTYSKLFGHFQQPMGVHPAPWVTHPCMAYVRFPGAANSNPTTLMEWAERLQKVAHGANPANNTALPVRVSKVYDLVKGIYLDSLACLFDTLAGKKTWSDKQLQFGVHQIVTAQYGGKGGVAKSCCGVPDKGIDTAFDRFVKKNASADGGAPVDKANKKKDRNKRRQKKLEEQGKSVVEAGTGGESGRGRGGREGQVRGRGGRGGERGRGRGGRMDRGGRGVQPV